MRHLRPLCKHCVFWAAEGPAETAVAGHCHRRPPIVLLNGETGTFIQKFPVTDHHQWCGEWSDDEQRLTDAARRSIAGRAIAG